MNKLASLLMLVAPSLAAAGSPAAGESAPEFTALDQDGRTVSLSSLKGKWVLLYFYPKDDTPGCTKQACDLRDGFTKFKKANVAVYGVSTQSAKSHQEFRAKHRLPFDLLVDEKGELGKLFGIGRYPVVGLYKRQSILIDPAGKIARRMEDVDPGKHADDILAVVNAGTGASGTKAH